jgi:hypothetical protein
MLVTTSADLTAKLWSTSDLKLITVVDKVVVFFYTDIHGTCVCPSSA